MILQNNNLVIYGYTPPGDIRCAAEVPYDTYISFRTSLEAQLWHDVARDAAMGWHEFSQEGLLDKVCTDMHRYSTLSSDAQQPLLIRRDQCIVLKAESFP